MSESERITAVQECRSLEGWQPVSVLSQTVPDKSYTVLINPWGDPLDNICECQGYLFRGTCRHIHTAKVCGWDEFDSLQQTDENRKNMICPRCSGATRWAMEVISD
jgi:hypothetical protein